MHILCGIWEIHRCAANLTNWKVAHQFVTNLNYSNLNNPPYHSSANPKVPRSHTGVMDYDEAYFMRLTPRVVHNFPKAVGVWDSCPLCTYLKRAGDKPGNSSLSSQQ